MQSVRKALVNNLVSRSPFTEGLYCAFDLGVPFEDMRELMINIKNAVRRSVLYMSLLAVLIVYRRASNSVYSAYKGVWYSMYSQ